MKKIKSAIRRSPLLMNLHGHIRELFRSKNFNSGSYWENRYATGGNSGAGSYGRLAEFKNETINSLVAELAVDSLIEYGCGDGNQLIHATYPQYLGFDPSQRAIEICEGKFGTNSNYSFRNLAQYAGENATLTMSLDVIYHLVEDQVFNEYMELLFKSSTRYVLIYSNNQESKSINNLHVKTRNFTGWVKSNCPTWQMIRHIKNKYPFSITDPENTSISDFYLFERK